MTAYPPIALQRTGFAIIVGLLLSVCLAVPATHAQQLILQVAIDEVTSEQGLVVVTGTVTCSDPTDFTEVSVEVRQPVGRFKSVVGSGSDSLGPCAEQLPFEVLAAPFSGSFKQGDVFVIGNVFGCGTTGCDNDAITKRVRLTK